ncbi:hypothetical protein AGMMS50293_09780 [Spirochaetia bacterium]|nr:hypothetical protein AGMMS50293_09780 [Spirochaetia bacterium]
MPPGNKGSQEPVNHLPLPYNPLCQLFSARLNLRPGIMLIHKDIVAG